MTQKPTNQQPSLFDTKVVESVTKPPETLTIMAKSETKALTSETEAIAQKHRMQSWIEVNTPAWQKILKESIETGDKVREKYAVWMLETVLKEK